MMCFHQAPSRAVKLGSHRGCQAASFLHLRLHLANPAAAVSLARTTLLYIMLIVYTLSHALSLWTSIILKAGRMGSWYLHLTLKTQNLEREIVTQGQTAKRWLS